MFNIYGVFTQKHQKIITGPLNGCGIFYTCLSSLEYIKIFLTKLIIKLWFENFWILLKFCSLFKVSGPQKPPKNHQQYLKGMQLLPKLLVLPKINVESFGKIVKLSIFVIFADIFKIIFSFDSVFAHKVPKNCHRSLEWVRLCLNSIVSFGVYIKTSNKIVS